MAEDLRRLKRENERLKRENEMLLKASAFFASRQLQEGRRRGRSSSSCSSTKVGGRSRRCAPRSRWYKEFVHFFKVDPDIKALVKTENPEEASVSISLATIDNHERATLVFTGGGADPLTPYSLNLLHVTFIGVFPEFDFSNFNNGEGTILETRHEYYIRCVFGSDVHLIATDTTDPEPDPEVKPNPEAKPNPTPQHEAEQPATEPVSATVSAVAKPADNTLPATGDNGALAIALGAAGAAATAAAAGVAVARRCSR